MWDYDSSAETEMGDGIKIGPDLHNPGPAERGIEAGLNPAITDITL